MKTILLFFLCLIGQSLSAKTITVINGNDAGLGSLRNALEQAQDGDIIEFSGVEEVTLISSFLTINENVTIKGNGTTLRANFSPLMKVATNATVRWERFNFEVPSNSFAQLTSPRKARVIFEACSGQWEKPNPPMTNTTKNSTDIVMEELRKGRGINYFVAPCPDPDNCGGGGGGGSGENPSCSISVITRNITVQLSTGGNVIITPEQINNGSTATCGPISFSLSRTFFTCDEIGSNIVTLSVTDANGSISNASATVTVVDNTAPSIASPQPVVVNTSTCIANVSLTTPPVLDACGISSITRNPSTNTFPVGITSVVWTVTDVNGNTATTTQTVTVRDATPPAFTTTPQNITVNGAPNCATVSLTPPSASDNCGITSITRSPEGNNFCIGTTSVVWTATDASGNTATVTQNVTVRDVTPPTFTATPPNLTLNGAPNTAVASFTPPIATDNWSSVTITSNPVNAAGGTFPIGTNSVVWTATDASGNTATFTQTIIVRDITPPTVTTPQPLNVNGTPCTAVVTLTPPSANDNVGIASITRNPEGNTFPVGTTSVVWAVTDNSGNATSVTQQVVVADVTAPTVITRNITVQLGANGTVTITDASVDNGSADACGPVTLSVSKKTFDCSNIGTNTVMLNVTDNSGNSGQANAIVTVQGTSITYYLDNDGDGFGNPQNSTTLCSNTPPIGFVINNTDCNDNNAAINPNTVWYKDADNDGYSDGTTQTQCAQPTNFKLATALTATNGDCDENNPNINPGASEECDGIDNNCNGQIDEGSTSTFYLDSDRDGFGNPSVSIQACLAPENYVTNNTDCDDSRADINPNTVWYEDRDGDGYPSNRTLTGCIRPQFFYGGVFSTTFSLGKLASELTGLTVDCDDTDATVSPGTLWYKDADNDGFSDGTSQQSCFQPSGYKRAGNVVPGGDCNDVDAAINPNTRWYPDLDNDNYSTGNFIVQCERPENYKLLRELTSTVGDCNDNDAALNPNTLWFKDQDGDGYTNGQTLRQCTRPENYKLQSELTNFATDCNDLDIEINPVTKWYKDADNDGYSEGTTVTQCLQPLGYRLESDLIGTSGDCNDSDATINPGATEVCGNGKDDDCNPTTSDVCALPDADGDGVPDGEDCAPNDATKYRNGTFFIDTDNDGYDNGQSEICYGEEIPNGYKATTVGTDCDDTDAAITLPRTWYQDTDNDGYSNGNTLTQCDRPTGFKLEGELMATSVDCNDENASINPGAAEVCDGIDNNCNGQTDEGFPDANNNGVADCVDPDNDMVSFTLINAGTDLDILTLTDGLQISQSQVQGLSLNIRANTNPTVVGSVFITISGPVNRTITENVAPYALFGDKNGDYNGRTMPTGNYTLTATPYSQTNRRGTAGSTTTISFSIVPTPVPVIGSFTLINAGSDTDILTLTDGLRISQSQVQGLSLNIRANTNPSVVGSVFLRISGSVNRSITENVAPYALFGDRNGNYSGRTLPVGNYTLEATPYSQSNRRGTIGATVTIKFSITSEAFRINGTQTESDESENPQENADVMEKDPQARDLPRITRMYPNPVSDIINLEFSEQAEEKVEVSIYDLKGVRLFTQDFESENGKLVLDISNLGLKPGMFVLLVNTNGYPQTFKFLKK